MVRLIAGFSPVVQFEKEKVKQEYLVCFLKSRTRVITEQFFQGCWKKEKTGRLFSHMEEDTRWLKDGSKYKKNSNDDMLNLIQKIMNNCYVPVKLGYIQTDKKELELQKIFTRTLFKKYALLYSAWNSDRNEYLVDMKKMAKKYKDYNRPVPEFYTDLTHNDAQKWWADKRGKYTCEEIARGGFEYTKVPIKI